EVVEGSYKGWETVVGYSKKFEVFGNETKIKFLEFSVMNLVPYVLVLVGLSCAATLRKANNPTSAWIGAVCFIAAGVLFFMAPNFLQFGEGLEGAEASDFELASGAMLAAIGSIIAGAALVVSNLMNKGETASAE
ncbi:MAG: hypothetical protein IKA88_03710, partial [Clostridia bacterium]|nr:hypothetical protein [Clostridia bacterium]